jgi:hypothetical protein
VLVNNFQTADPLYKKDAFNAPVAILKVEVLVCIFRVLRK